MRAEAPPSSGLRERCRRSEESQTGLKTVTRDFPKYARGTSGEAGRIPADV